MAWIGAFDPKDPTVDELRQRAKFQVGDSAYMHGHQQWKVVRRWWSRSRECIMYALLFERNGYVTEAREEDLSR